ncbi:Spermidine/putrescine transport system permease protein PotB [uncultured Eubacterium sp.]|nr:Spermidine/putrescine transport system permease protein PotB [uncultured Eubacterium sp.]
MKNDKLKSILGIPYFLFLVIFVVCPVLILLYYAFTNGAGEFSLENFTLFFIDSKAIGTLIYSAMIAVVTTIVCLLVAYPVAYILAKGEFRRGNVLLMLFVMPMWINFTLRITALKEILTLIEGNLAFHPFLNTVIGMTYDFLPFMILPIYNTIAKIDHSYIEAAKDLGAKSYRVFLRVILPLSIPGIISGVTMVFLPSMTNYVVLDMMYNSTYIMGSLVGSYFSMYDWNNGSVISMILLILILLLSMMTGEFSDKEDNAYE